MIRHIVFFKFKPEIEQATRQEFSTMLHQLADDIDVIQQLEVGENFTESPRACDLALTVDVNNETDLQTYDNHPDHQPVKTRAREICSATYIADYVRS